MREGTKDWGLDGFVEYTNWVLGKAEETKNHYKSALKEYCVFTGLDPKELIDEAEEDLTKSRRERGKPERRLKEFLEHLRGCDYSETTVKHRFASMKSFYSSNKFSQNVSIPKAAATNTELKIRKGHVRKFVEHAPTLRDRGVVLVMFQSGMDVSTLCTLNYGHMARGLESDECPLPIRIERPKERVSYTTFISRDAINALKTYLNHRRARGEKIEWGSPLFVKERRECITKKGGKREYRQPERLETHLIQKMMKKVAVDSGMVSKEQMESAKLNPCRPHTLRKAFSSIMQLQGVNSDVIDGLMGHTVRYGGAYSQLAEEELKDIYGRHSEMLGISERPEFVKDYEERLNVFGKTIEELVRDKGEKEREIDELKEKYRKFEESRVESDDLMTGLFKDKEFQNVFKRKVAELRLI